MATLLAGVAALLGATVAAIVGSVHNARATFFHALDWLSGGTQRRSLGIATIEVVWRRRRSLSGRLSGRLFGSYGYFRDLSIPVLESAAVYLLLAKDQPLEAHERRNLERIMSLLLEVKATELGQHGSVYKDLSEVLAKADDKLKAARSKNRAQPRPEGSQPPSFPDLREKQIGTLKKEAATLEKSAQSIRRDLANIEGEPDDEALDKLLQLWRTELSRRTGSARPEIDAPA